MNVSRYTPRPLLLPADSSLTRRFYDKRSHLPGKPPLGQQDYAGFESHTIFNDLYIDPGTGYLRAIGPPLVNLQQALCPIRITLPGQTRPLRHHMSNHDRVTFHRFDLPRQSQQVDTLQLSCAFADGLVLHTQAQRHRLRAVELQFVTLQKNNPVAWVLDWLRYCQSLGVERVLLYDNGSDNVEELYVALGSNSPAFANGLEVVLIDWPFPYGPVRSFYNQFCQAAQNNHAHQCFGQATWVGHFDIDEYLVMYNGVPLRRMLDESSPCTGLLRFDSYWVPYVAHVKTGVPEEQANLDKPPGQPPTVRDFAYREKQTRGKAHKYIVRSQRLRMANTHNGKVTLGFRRKPVAPADAAFLHYKALTTDWRGYELRGGQERFDAGQHVRDESVIEQLQQLSTSGHKPVA